MSGSEFADGTFLPEDHGSLHSQAGGDADLMRELSEPFADMHFSYFGGGRLTVFDGDYQVGEIDLDLCFANALTNKFMLERGELLALEARLVNWLERTRLRMSERVEEGSNHPDRGGGVLGRDA